MPKPIQYVPIELSGEQWSRLSEALQSAFQTFGELQILVREQLGENIAGISAQSNPLPTIAYDLIQWAQGRGLGGNLVDAARLTRPGSPRIQAIAAELLDGDIVAQRAGEPPKAVVGRALEKMVRQNLGFADADLWWRAMGEVLPRVCRVEVDLGTHTELGTGFLVGADVVMTNQHVVGSVIDQPGGGAKIRCRFDYKTVRGSSVVVNPGTAFALDGDWLIDASPPSPLDTKVDQGNEEPSPEHLDYALLRLADAVADLPLGGSAAPGAAKRGYVSILNAAPPPGAGSPLYIVQHPQGGPVKLALDTEAILWTKATRVRYRTNTEPGSSGSPCFDADWKPVALHHLGDPSYSTALFNEGIPLATIVARLSARNKAGDLGT